MGQAAPRPSALDHEVYLHSNTTIKQDAIDKTAAIDTPPGRYKPTDKLLAFLENL
jgi:integrase/recombinase XerD